VFQKWSQLKCTKSNSLTARKPRLSGFLKSFALVAILGTPNYSQAKSLPKLMQEIESKYSKAQTLSADFSQKNLNAAFSKKKISSGKIYFKRPSKIRWETLKPDPNIMASDGKTFWFYTPPFDSDERGQLLERPATAIQSKLANALLSGSFSVARTVNIKQLNPTTFVLVPFPGTADTVQRATLVIDAERKLITNVTLEHKGGNKSEIALSNITLGQELENSLFILIPPPNTDKVTD
jgi:outer membrane lipoprotein carrier protein